MQKKISLSFDSSWVLSKKDEDQLPVEKLVDSVKEILDVEVLDTSITECEILIKNESITEETIKNEILALIKKLFAVEDVASIVECSVSEHQQLQKAEEKKAEPQAQEAAPCTQCAMDKINALIGADEFKALAEECVKVAPGLLKHNAVEAFTHQCYVFSINKGNGLSTYLNLFADLLSELKLFNFAQNNKVAEERILEQAQNPFQGVYSLFQGFGSKGGRIISIDISEWMTKVTGKEFREFLSFLEDHIGQNIIVFNVPFVEKEILNKLCSGLSDVLYVRDVSFVPFDSEELTQFAKASLDKRGFTMDEGAWEIFHTRVNEEKSDGRFYGINTINKVVLEMIYRKQLENAQSGADDTLIKKSEIQSLAASYHNNEKSGLELLDEFIGMKPIKQRIEEIVAQIEMSIKNRNLGYPCIHMRFVGNPGTGKTTVARVLGKVLKEKGILRNGSFFEYAGRDFCGRYVGETAPKTAAMCRDAYGSVLFIDEAYSLYRGDGFSKADYGREAIDTLIAEMENHRSDLVVIMAGYPDEMDTLMKANAGLESRMPYIVEFPNYSRQELYDIFMFMVNKNFKYQEGFTDLVKEYFDTLPDEVILSKEFSNARFVRNLFERTWGKAVLRAQLKKEDSSVLTKDDFQQASSEKEFKKIMTKQKRTLGFV